LNPAFTLGYIRRVVPTFSEKTENPVITVLEQLRSQSDGGIEMLQFLSRSTFDIIGSAGLWILSFTDVGFGYELNSLHNPDDSFLKA
jgi:hypothetical protein